eukprot:TRINITY_DN822_c0_g1_i1.p1 TRINITY_DN822_c0_g1~~TRINITY_DN822_c0_g1_i1.p1  ORF type:complete len:235 (+),score=49.06 TRINITY_DN822_c0_g1_i1:152-856(+)
MSSPTPPRVLSIKSLDTDSIFESQSLSDSIDNSLYESTTSSLIDPPIPANTTYSGGRSSPTPQHRMANSTWDYDNYIEKPRVGQVAEPRFVSPSSSEDFPARSFIMDQPQPAVFTSIGASPVILGILAYFFGFIGGFVIMLLEKKNLFVIFHAWQSMLVGVFAFLFQIVFVWSSTLYTLLWIAYLLFEFFMIVRVIMDAPSQKLFKLPMIGDWCEHRAFNKIQQHAGDFYRMAP